MLSKKERKIRSDLTCFSHKLCSGVRQTVILDESKLFEGKVCKPFQKNVLCSDEMTDVAVHPDVCEKSRLRAHEQETSLAMVSPAFSSYFFYFYFGA